MGERAVGIEMCESGETCIFADGEASSKETSELRTFMSYPPAKAEIRYMDAGKMAFGTDGGFCFLK